MSYCFPGYYLMLRIASSLSRMDQPELEGEEIPRAQHISNSRDPQAVFPYFKLHHQTTHGESLPNGS